MKKKYFVPLTATLALGCMGLLGGLPVVHADAIPPTTTQDLTSLGTISTSVTGLSDLTFAKAERKYQLHPITDLLAWTGFCHQGGRDITVQFADPVDVQHIQITMEQDPSQGIYYPNHVQFEVYENGQWISLETQDTSISTSNSSKTTEVFQFDSSTGVETSQIRLNFPVNVFVFARGLDVTGSTTETGTVPTSPVVSPASSGSTSFGALAPNSPNAHGIKNMLMVPTGSYGPLGTWFTGDFEPMLEYINSTGQAVGPLFDTMLFAPFANVQNTVDSWNAYLDDLFANGQELSALNDAVGMTNQSLNRPGYQEKVILSIPYFPYGMWNFGMVNGQPLNFIGTPADPNAVEARNTAMTWYVDTVLSRWQSANYQNLQLVGLYWNHEQYSFNKPGEQQMFQDAETLAHNHGLPLLWIPYYSAPGGTQWQSLGLDAAWIQPNYIEQGENADVNRIRNAETLAKSHGMGVEIELTGLDAPTRSLYQTFLNQLSTDGFDSGNVSYAFYDGSKLLLDAEQSGDPSQRSIYDETAAFIMH